MIKQHCTIINAKGMHARAAAEVVKLVNQFESTITIEHEGREVPADSLIHLLTLAANCGKQIQITAHGHDEQQAIAALSQLIVDGFYEKP
ncbi:HPr family phosphocarrier protein [Pleionea litopenaei]|uniref:HPr family phosphocarrier protein n=1 Tax=Pleionea litopenaei TaxID=3070815 RepID=A0AA51RT97_9GAMM|nr:HPr family phosphocarrier protein [Pleionea sp. HL-JVS1]WMS87110.1 HPr family phosphocarrier protein [Pleionea sp. HL-JVS1]